MGPNEIPSKTVTVEQISQSYYNTYMLDDQVMGRGEKKIEEDIELDEQDEETKMQLNDNEPFEQGKKLKGKMVDAKV